MRNNGNCLVQQDNGVNQQQFIEQCRNSFQQLGYHFDGTTKKPEEIFSVLAPLQVLNALGWLPSGGEYISNQTKRDRELVKIFMLAQTPKEFFCDQELFPIQKGYTLYHFDLVLNN
jgi:hypothetical protein